MYCTRMAKQNNNNKPTIYLPKKKQSTYKWKTCGNNNKVKNTQKLIITNKKSSVVT